MQLYPVQELLNDFHASKKVGKRTMCGCSKPTLSSYKPNVGWVHMSLCEPLMGPLGCRGSQLCILRPDKTEVFRRNDITSMSVRTWRLHIITEMKAGPCGDGQYEINIYIVCGDDTNTFEIYHMSECKLEIFWKTYAACEESHLVPKLESSTECSVKVGHFEYDLRSLSSNEDAYLAVNKVSEDIREKFYVTPCGYLGSLPRTGCRTTSSACWVLANTREDNIAGSWDLGSIQKTVNSEDNTLHFTNGSRCPYDFNKRFSSTISFGCDPLAGRVSRTRILCDLIDHLIIVDMLQGIPYVTSFDHSNCHVHFEWYTALVCRSGDLEHNPERLISCKYRDPYSGRVFDLSKLRQKYERAYEVENRSSRGKFWVAHCPSSNSLILDSPIPRRLVECREARAGVCLQQDGGLRQISFGSFEQAKYIFDSDSGSLYLTLGGGEFCPAENRPRISIIEFVCDRSISKPKIILKQMSKCDAHFQFLNRETCQSQVASCDVEVRGRSYDLTSLAGVNPYVVDHAKGWGKYYLSFCRDLDKSYGCSDDTAVCYHTSSGNVTEVGMRGSQYVDSDRPLYKKETSDDVKIGMHDGTKKEGNQQQSPISYSITEQILAGIAIPAVIVIIAVSVFYYKSSKQRCIRMTCLYMSGGQSGDISSTARSSQEEAEKEENKEKKIILADDTQIESKAIGNVKIKTKEENLLILKDVLFVPQIKRNLLSIGKLIQDYQRIIFSKDKCTIIDFNDQVILEAPKIDDFYIINSSGSRDEEDKVFKVNWDIWHKRLGHPNENYMTIMKNKNLVYKFDCISKEDLNDCITCIKSKYSRKPFKRIEKFQTSQSLEPLHIDLIGPIKEESIGKARFILTIVDDYSSKLFTRFLKSKSETQEILKEFIEYIENTTNKRIKKFRSDNGTEFNNQELESNLKRNGIEHQRTTFFSPSQNGRCERTNRSLIEGARALLIESGLPIKFWAEAMNTYTYLKNRTPSYHNTNKTPEEMFTGRKPTVSHLKVFGCKVKFWTPKHKRSKFEKITKTGILVGYSSCRKAYRICNSENFTITETRDVAFLENQMGAELHIPLVNIGVSMPL
ncbi:hypothetical protein LAZ67_6001832 [Cordylochernes scorpioides]|uniref:Retrovirus-related Pol polyprotein from transposon TNT 1-94 n=1 Tax=Cordylochernes scorpioides TaxID=51811 RepID=A0ABY6KJF5_9ARAC|nr:hypothetical protein LAZ67_6001832 [Cordylochernes scorpioides]